MSETDVTVVEEHVGKFCFSERASASPTSPYHIRVIDASGYKVSGGLKALAVCGYDLTGGWDVSEAWQDRAEVIALAQMWIDNRFIHAPCGKCLDNVRGM